ncbi:LysR family transcriptional regulator [Mycolicibacterium monacense]|uniref:Probable hydrogen peroxide-inducible genes activator n=4 Tax=Mycobacteriaceae TaxID=1762 RepID=A0AAD1J3D6_MYCMB|nr:LysR family transcriptional regulator [Mycolicibacterium monacense]MDA4103977.1 LysR family transcriptional regulator [Mycolicibacterium monacense DSM 44395]OBB75209.1 LysR family transcriptional regulator [Mycolicibacterium monacense]ORB23213.1 LysR family transcriptional regulator [Mycolicibacterium monacense DSM 44395]QHP85236.1 LysR family transcriptional regulator [Mycolicibacterium monacense DSM 44395]BBZ61917.1 LysR family transcriptional regulator [Mycolicibacterium monacense]
MNLRQYEYALAVAEEGSMTAAAERLRITQPSLSQQIGALEKHLGVQLFTRTPSGVTVTMAGRAFLAEAKIATTASRRAIAAARAADGELAGELIIAVHMGLGARQLPQALGQLRNRHPKLQVTLHEEPDPADMERLARQGTLDMVLVHRIPAGCTFDTHRLGEEAYVAVLPKGHPRLSDGAALRLEDLASEGWIRFRRASLLDDYLARTLADAGLSPQTVARASQISTAVRLVSQGLGVTVVPASAIPEGFEELACPLVPALTEPVLVGMRRNPGSAETAMLDHLNQQNWCGTGLLCQPATA